MAKLQIERIGGLGGFGGFGARIRSHGEVEMEALSTVDQQVVEALFQSDGKEKHSQVRDGFRYRISRNIAGKAETIEAPEMSVPLALSQSVKDELI